MLNFSFKLNKQAECPSKEELMATKGYSEEEAIAYIATHGLVERRLRRRAGEVVKREPKKNKLPNQNSDSYIGKFNYKDKNRKANTDAERHKKNTSESLNNEEAFISSLLKLSVLVDASNATMQPCHWTPAFATPQQLRISRIKQAAQKMAYLNAPCPSQETLMKRYSPEEIAMYVAEHQKITQRRHLKRNAAKLPIMVPGEPILEIEPMHHFQSNRFAYEENECDALFQDGMYFNFSVNEESARDTEADNMTVATESSIRVISPK